MQELTDEQILQIIKNAPALASVDDEYLNMGRAIIDAALAQQAARHAEELLAYEVTVSNRDAEIANLRVQREQGETVEMLLCDFCGVETPDPWHGHTETDRHVHACDGCKPRLSPHPSPQPERKPAPEDKP